MKYVLLTHMLSLETAALLALIKSVLLWTREPLFERFHRYTSWPVKLLVTTGIVAGFYMLWQWYEFFIPNWLLLKFGMVILAFTLVIMGENRKNKMILSLGSLLLLLIIVQANMKYGI